MESGEIPFYLKYEVRVLDCKFKNVTLYNTDNMGKLFVTLFAFTLHPRQICNGCCTRTRTSARNNALCIVITYWLRSTLYRDTAPVPATNFVTGDKFVAPINFAPRHS
jgi:hypothetical protein